MLRLKVGIFQPFLETYFSSWRSGRRPGWPRPCGGCLLFSFQHYTVNQLGDLSAVVQTVGLYRADQAFGNFTRHLIPREFLSTFDGPFRSETQTASVVLESKRHMD